MSKLTFIANIENGKIIIPKIYQQELNNINTVEITVIKKENNNPRIPGLLNGKLGKTFFEPLPEEELQQWENNI
jgi:hypothetical protein